MRKILFPAVALAAFGAVACGDTPTTVPSHGVLFHPMGDSCHNLSTPQLNAEAGVGSVMFKWNVIDCSASGYTGAVGYDIQIAAWGEDTWVALGADISVDGQLTAEHSVENLEDGDYRARIRARSSSTDHHSSWSSWEEFTLLTTDSWELLGFYRPVQMLSDGTCNGVQRNRTVPLKFNAEKNGEAITTVAELDNYSINVAPFFCAGGTAAEITEGDALATGNTVIRWDDDDQQFIYNWAVGSMRGGVKVTLTIGNDELTTYFNIR